jgi:hypothetical protein
LSEEMEFKKLINGLSVTKHKARCRPVELNLEKVNGHIWVSSNDIGEDKNNLCIVFDTLDGRISIGLRPEVVSLWLKNMEFNKRSTYTVKRCPACDC